jgi:hypothetical protein
MAVKKKSTTAPRRAGTGSKERTAVRCLVALDGDERSLRALVELLEALATFRVSRRRRR